MQKKGDENRKKLFKKKKIKKTNSYESNLF